MGYIQTIPFKNFIWTNISQPGKKEIEYLRQNYKFHPLDLKDCLTPSQRSKVDIYSDYTFIVFLFPTFKREAREIQGIEFNIFVSKKYLITLHQGEIKAFADFFNLFRVSDELRKKYPDESPERLLYEILNKLFFYCLPMIDELILECDKTEKAIFSGEKKEVVSEILNTRRKIIDFRKIMQVHKNVLKKLILNLKESPLYIMKKTDVYFESLIDYTKETWDSLENLKERIEALQQTNESQLTFHLNEIIKILTIISVIIFPVTLVAAIFGMNTVQAMPFVGHPLGFWFVIAIMTGIIITMLTIFKKKGWL